MIQKNIEPLEAKLDQLEEKLLRESLKVRKRGEKKLFSSVVVLCVQRANFIRSRIQTLVGKILCPAQARTKYLEFTKRE